MGRGRGEWEQGRIFSGDIPAQFFSGTSPRSFVLEKPGAAFYVLPSYSRRLFQLIHLQMTFLLTGCQANLVPEPLCHGIRLEVKTKKVAT
jgi:hypothetical protein